MRRPITSTYRLQLRGPDADPAGRRFGFAEAADQVPYLRDLGVSHLYLSPIFTAPPTSSHNYDITDPNQVNPALGGIEGLRALADTAHGAGMGLIVDIVPNHLGVESPHLNRWWWDVLKHGRDSEYAHFFDIDWSAGKINLPVLGSPDDTAALHLDSTSDGERVLRYHDRIFPLAPGTYPTAQSAHEKQAYALTYWRESDVSYRRFFSINGLAGLRQEDPDVFDRTHQGLRVLLDDNLIDGVRVDHPDGLAAPHAYLKALRKMIGPDRWLIVEKILASDEPLDAQLPVDGTTGYDALREFDGVFVDPAAATVLPEAESSAAAMKRRMAQSELAPEIRRLARVIGGEDVTDTLIQLLSHLPVYRADYPSLSRVTATTVADIAVREPHRRPALDTITAALANNDEAATRFAQVSGAVMAKGVEDTLFYRLHRLVALQEVGGAPERFGVSPAEFHLLQAERERYWPRAMTTLTTHDTKRSEDTRARIIGISELPDEYISLARDVFAATPPPDEAAGHFLLQNILGAWPRGDEKDFLERMQAYALKAVREADRHTSWTDNNAEYEAHITEWVAKVVGSDQVAAFALRLNRAGEQVSLGRKLLHLVGPGIPDVYQGQEGFDFSLVDPDNRRFVDYGPHEQAADRAKHRIVREALTLRRDHPEYFRGYRPVLACGEAARHLIGMERTNVIAVATRLPVALERRGGWGDTTISLDGTWTDQLTGRVFHGVTAVRELLSDLPTALLVRRG